MTLESGLPHVNSFSSSYTTASMDEDGSGSEKSQSYSSESTIEIKKKTPKCAHNTRVWDTVSLNPSWVIDEKVKQALPIIIERTKATTDSLENKFLAISQLPLPRISSTLDITKAFDEVKGLENDSLSFEDKANYFSNKSSKENFYQVYHKLSSQKNIILESIKNFQEIKDQKYLAQEYECTEDTIGIFKPGNTARHQFLSSCLDRNLLPSSRLILRKVISPSIEVPHMGMGDELAQAFADCLSSLPMVTSINIRDNRLSDRGIGCIIQCIIHKSDLLYLDLSQNKVDGEAAKALANYMKSSSCSIVDLKLGNADVNDSEAEGFISALHSNRSLTCLDLSHNIIGSSEMMNVVQPDLLTGGEAIAQMLHLNNTLTRLDLSWNILRLNSALEIGRALAQNSGLKELSIAYNAFGNEAAQAIGESLLVNNCLEVLDLTCNNIPYQAAFVIAGAIRVNSTFKRIILNGNPLGNLGGRTLLQAVASAGNKKFSIAMEQCNFELKECGVFNPDEATGTYDLDLTIPYHRSVALELLRLANEKNGCKFISVNHVIGSGREKINTNITLTKQEVNLLNLINISRRSTERRASIEGFSLEEEDLIMVFKQLDKDKSGGIDANELDTGLRSLGIVPREGEAFRLIAQYDLDGTGLIEIDEFIHLMAEFQVTKQSHTEIIDASTNLPFDVPNEGHLLISFVDLHLPAENQGTQTREGIERLIDNLKNSTNTLQMLDIVKKGMSFKAEEAQMIIDALHGSSDTVEALGAILPHMLDSYQAIQLIESNLDNKGRLRLQQLMGRMYGPIVGLATGHYRLDLGEANDRILARKLVEINNKTMYRRTKYHLADTSQHKNHQCFRNEMFNGTPIILISDFFDVLPLFGVLEFDFIELSSHKKTPSFMSKSRFTQMTQKLYFDQFIPMKNYSTPPTSASLDKRSQSVIIGSNELMQNNNLSFLDHDTNVKEEILSTCDIIVDGKKETWSGRRMLYELQAALGSRWISARQAKKILSCWPIAFEAQRFDALLIIFCRIADLYNFNEILGILSLNEVQQCYIRLGWLNVWCPLAPDQKYELDLSNYEERSVAQMLVQLAMDEPGENWQDETFGYILNNPLPGWELNMSWLKEGGFPQKGFLCLSYYSGADLGCAPNWSSRKSLMKNVLATLPTDFEEYAKGMNFVYRTKTHASKQQDNE